MRRLLLVISAVMLLQVHADAQRQRTTIGMGRSRSIRSHIPAGTGTSGLKWTEDTLSGVDDCVKVLGLSGYDKPISANRETVHVTNLSDSLTVTGFEMEILYLDRQGRELHRRFVTVNETIETGHTEMVSFPTWDLQRSFYYRLSVKPRRQATPYDVRCSVRNVFYRKP
ncbi:MAG: hypothetical protein NC082_07435 [Clostridiales bacterium]|nr:hypothetical protein [Clostridiales bacterium]